MTGAELIAQERARQVAQEGWTPDHDDEHIDGELVRAAQAYLLPNGGGFPAAASWPFTDGFKPEGRIRNLVKAGALIAAEVDRLQRKPICWRQHVINLIRACDHRAETGDMEPFLAARFDAVMALGGELPKEGD